MNDGGPAFPSFNIESTTNQDNQVSSVFSNNVGGMSLRDYFAAASIGSVMNAQIELARLGAITNDNFNKLHKAAASAAYEIADAMLAEREKNLISTPPANASTDTAT